MASKLFKSASGEPVRLALLSGHIAVVGNEWIQLDERFHSSAYASGCISNDMALNNEISINQRTVEILDKVAQKKEKILGAMRTLVEDYNSDNFTTGNKPKTSLLTEMIGERVMNNERDELWYTLQDELKDNDPT